MDNNNNDNNSLSKIQDDISQQIIELKALKNRTNELQEKYNTFKSNNIKIKDQAELKQLRELLASHEAPLKLKQKVSLGIILQSIDDPIIAEGDLALGHNELNTINSNISDLENALPPPSNTTKEGLNGLNQRINKVKNDLDAQMKKITDANQKANETLSSIGLLKKYEGILDRVEKLKKLHTDILTLQVDHTKKSEEFDQLKKQVDPNEINTDIAKIRDSYEWIRYKTNEQLNLYTQLFNSIDDAFSPNVEKTINQIQANLRLKQNKVTGYLSIAESELANFFNNNTLPSDDDLTRVSNNISLEKNDQISVDESKSSKPMSEICTRAQGAINNIKIYDAISKGIINLEKLKTHINGIKDQYDKNNASFLRYQQMISTNPNLRLMQNHVNTPSLTPENRALYSLMFKSINGSIDSSAKNDISGFGDTLQTELTYVEKLIGDAEVALKSWTAMNDSELGTDINRIHKLLYEIKPNAQLQQSNNNGLSASNLKTVSEKDINEFKVSLQKTLNDKVLAKTIRAKNALENFTILSDLYSKNPNNSYTDRFSWRAVTPFIRSNLLHHLIGSPGHKSINSTNKISGTHSKTNFDNMIWHSRNQAYLGSASFYYEISSSHPGNGIDDISYSRYDLMTDPNTGQASWRQTLSDVKTVYDPDVLSDVYIQYYGVQAAMEAYEDNSKHTSQTQDFYFIKNVEYGGLLYDVGFKKLFDKNNNLIDKSVETVFPVKNLARSTYNDSKFVSKIVAKQTAQYIASIYNGFMDADTKEHQKLISNTLDDDGNIKAKANFWDGYNNYETVRIPNYSDQDKTLADLYELSSDKLDSTQLGALTRRIEEAKSNPAFQLRAEHEIAHGHSYKIFDQHFSKYEDYINGDYSNSYLLSQRLLSTDSTRQSGYCYALSRSMAVILADGDIEQGRQFLKNVLYKAIEQDRSSGKHQTKDLLSGWNNWANERHAAFVEENRLAPLKTLDEIKNQLVSETKTAMYELNTSKHAMVVGVLVANNKRQYVFYDPEHGLRELVESGNPDNFFKGLASFLGDPERSTAYGVSKEIGSNELKFELIPIDTTNEVAKNMWVLDPNQSRVAYSLEWQPNWISNFNNANNPNTYSIDKGKSLLDAINKGSVLTQADMLAIFAGGGKSNNRVIVVDSNKQHLANLQYILHLAQNTNYKAWLEKVAKLYPSKTTELYNLFDQIEKPTEWFKQLKNRIQKDGFVFIHADLAKPGEGVNLQAYVGSGPISTVHNLHNTNIRVDDPIHFLNNMSYIHGQEVQFTYAASGQIVSLNDEVDRTIKSPTSGPVLELMQKHGVSDPVLHLMSDANQLDQLVTKQNDIRTEIQKIKPELTKDHILVYDAIEHKPNGDITVHLVHRNGNQNGTRLVDIYKSQNKDLINNINQVHKNYKKLASSPKWVNRVDKVDDTIGYIGLLNQYRAIIQGEQLHPATLEHQLIGYGQFAVANTQAATQVTTKASQYLSKMASTVSKANQFMKVGSIVGKAGKALPVIGVALEGGSFALSVNDLVKVFHDSHPSDLQKGQAISNVVLGGAGLTVSVVTVGAMLAGAGLVAGAATGVGLLLIPIVAGVGAIFEYYQDMESADQTYKYIGSITRAYDQGFVLKKGTLYSEYGAVVKKIDLRAGGKCIYFGSQTVESQKTKPAWGDSSGDRYRDGSDVNTEKNMLFADSTKSIQGAVNILVLPMTANQNLKYVYNDGSLDASSLDAGGRRTMKTLAEKGVANSYYYLGGSNTEQEKKIAVSAYGIHPELMSDTCIEVFLDKEVKNLYTPTLTDKLAHNKLTYAIQGDGGQYTLTLADKVKFTLSENTNSSSTWTLNSSNMVEKDDIQIQPNKLIIGRVEIDVSRLSTTSNLIIHRQNGDVCTIDLTNNTKTLTQMSGQEYVKRQADLSVDGYMLPKGDQYMLIKNYQHNNQNVGNAYYNSDKKQLLLSIPTKDSRQATAIGLMVILDELMADPALYQIECQLEARSWTNYYPGGGYAPGGSTHHSESGYIYKLKENKEQIIKNLKESINKNDFQAQNSLLYTNINQWLNDYATNTQKIKEEVSKQSKKWQKSGNGVTSSYTPATILNENSFLKQVDWTASSAVSWIKQQQDTLESLHDQIQQKFNPLYNAALGGIDENNRYFFNIQKGLVWQTDATGAIKKQYALPLGTSEWDYKHLSFRQATNAKGEKLFLLGVIAHSRTGNKPISRSLTYQIKTGQMDLLVDHTDRSNHTHPAASEPSQSVKFSNVPQVTPKNSLDYVHFYNEENVNENYWMHKGQRIYADLPNDVSIQARKYISMDRIQSDGDQPDLFYFYDQKNKNFYQQEGNGTARDTTNPKAKLIGTANQKTINAFVHNGFAWATDERGVTYQVGRNGMLDTIAHVNLDPAWLSTNGKENWITWLKSDLLQNMTDKTHQIRIHGLKSQTADGETYAWYENNKLKVVDIGKDLSFIGLDHTGNQAYLFNDQTGKLHQQAISELSSKNNDLSADGYALKNRTTNNILLPTWTFSKATVLDWKELVGSQNAVNKILSLEIKKEANDQESLSLLWDVKKNKKTLTIARPADIIRYKSMLGEVDALILLVDPHANDSAYTYNLDTLLTLAGKIKLITIKYQNTRSNTNIFDQLQYSAKSTTKFGQFGNDLYITDDRGTVHLQNVFTSEEQTAYKQLKFQISKTDFTTFSKSVLEVAKQLKDAEGLRSAMDFYRLSDFVNTSQLICEEKNQSADIVGSINDDTLKGSKLPNSIYGLQGNDRLEGGDGNDDMYGQEGNDKLYGGEGRDILHGGTGNDQIWGGDNEDELYGEEGNDELYGGSGDDLYVFTAGDGHDIIDDDHGIDVIYFSQANQNNTYTFDRSANDLIIDYGNQDQVTVRDHFDPTKGKSIAGLDFQNSGMIDLEKASEWVWSLSDQATFKKDGDDLCISDRGDTFVLKNIFSSSNLSACMQLGLQITGLRTYRPTVLAVDIALNQAFSLNQNAHHWYKWTNFLKAGVLINLTDDRINHAIGVTNSATIIGDNLANKLYSNGDESVLSGMKGDDELYGGTGSDIYRFHSNDGVDRIVDSGGTDIIEFAPGIEMRNMCRKGDDLLIEHGQASSIRVKGHFGITSAQPVELLKLSNGNTYQIRDLVRQAEELSKDKNRSNWKFTIDALVIGTFSSTQVDVDSPSPSTTTNDTLDFSTWKGPKEPSATGQDLDIDLKQKLWRILRSKKEGAIADQIKNIIGSANNEHFIGSDQANKIHGGGGRDVFEGGKGNNTLVDGTSEISSQVSGDSTYIFAHNDGQDDIWDWGGSDTIRLAAFSIPNSKSGRNRNPIPQVSFLKDQTDLVIKNNADTNSSIRIHDHFLAGQGIEYFEWGENNRFNLKSLTDSKNDGWSQSYALEALKKYKIEL